MEIKSIEVSVLVENKNDIYTDHISLDPSTGWYIGISNFNNTKLTTKYINDIRPQVVRIFVDLYKQFQNQGRKL